MTLRCDTKERFEATFNQFSPLWDDSKREKPSGIYGLIAKWYKPEDKRLDKVAEAFISFLESHQKSFSQEMVEKRDYIKMVEIKISLHPSCALLTCRLAAILERLHSDKPVQKLQEKVEQFKDLEQAILKIEEENKQLQQRQAEVAKLPIHHIVHFKEELTHLPHVETHYDVLIRCKDGVILQANSALLVTHEWFKARQNGFKNDAIQFDEYPEFIIRSFLDLLEGKREPQVLNGLNTIETLVEFYVFLNFIQSPFAFKYRNEIFNFIYRNYPTIPYSTLALFFKSLEPANVLLHYSSSIRSFFSYLIEHKKEVDEKVAFYWLKATIDRYSVSKLATMVEQGQGCEKNNVIAYKLRLYYYLQFQKLRSISQPLEPLLIRLSDKIIEEQNLKIEQFEKELLSVISEIQAADQEKVKRVLNLYQTLMNLINKHAFPFTENNSIASEVKLRAASQRIIVLANTFRTFALDILKNLKDGGVILTFTALLLEVTLSEKALHDKMLLRQGKFANIFANEKNLSKIFED